MQPSNNHRRRPDRNHGEQRDHGERSRRDRTGEFESHRYARRPRKHDGLGDGPEAITASRDVDEPQGNDYVQSWLRKTQESRVERSRPEGEEVQRRVPRKESPRAHLEMLRGKTKKRTRPAPSLSASLSGRSEHLEDRQFEKRARHKTLADKYEYRPDKKKVVSASRNSRAERRAQVADDPGLVASKSSKKSGAKGHWRIQGSEKELDEFSNFFHDLEDRRGSPTVINHRHLQNSTSPDGGEKGWRRSSTEIPESAQKPPSARQRRHGSKFGSYFTWSTSHYSEVDKDRHGEVSLNTERGPTKSSAKAGRNGRSLDRHSRSSHQPRRPSHRSGRGQGYRDAQVQTELKQDERERQSHAREHSRHEEQGGVLQEGGGTTVPGRWDFVEEAQPFTAEEQVYDYTHSLGRTSTARPAGIPQTRLQGSLGYPGPSIPAYWKQASPARPRYTLSHEQPRPRPTFEPGSATWPLLLADQHPLRTMSMTSPLPYVVRQPLYVEEEVYVGGGGEQHDSGHHQFAPVHPYEAPRYEEHLQSAQELPDAWDDSAWDGVPPDRRPHVQAMADFIDKIEQEVYTARSEELEGPGHDVSLVEGELGENLCGATAEPTSAQDEWKDPPRTPTGDILWFGQ